MFVICITWFGKSGTASGSSHLSGHPQDPEMVCITGAVCFQECFSLGATRSVGDG